ncbi:MAG TPA: FAD-binding oxidoreductase [Victivallales bacterium]|nr:FAD-binding oxidoreductase [Victivallales bacterium]
MIFLKAVIFINLYVFAIGILIIFMDKVISNYGKCKIKINDDKEFEEEGGKTLLKGLFENKYFIPSACGGKGTCGYCKLKVEEGGGPALPTEALILNSRELKENYRLSCQVKLREDIKVTIPAEYLKIKEYNATIENTELVTSDIKKVKIGLPENEEISFKAGQYVQVMFDTPEGLDYRAYSIASNPEIKNTIELNVKLIPEGLGSSFVHAKKANDNIQFSGPYGEFFLRTDSHRKIICVAGGVGLAPMKSIVDYWNQHPQSRKCELYYGSRTVKDLYDHKLFEKIANENSDFSYYPALSDKDPDWNGEEGFIHKIIEKHLEDGANSEAYLCGPEIMINAVTEVLVSKGILEERISYDKF